jgi:hypothetical protein
VKLFFYAPLVNGQAKKLLDKLAVLRPRLNMRTCGDLMGLELQLRQPNMDSKIVILFPESAKDLEGLSTISQWLMDLPLIIVLPDRQKDTIALAHRLRPRFVTDIDCDFESEVTAILGHMIKAPRK